MQWRLFAITAAVSALAWCPPVHATTFSKETFTCPVGGQKFRDDVIASMTSWGQRPDGRRYGTTPVIALTECPKNGFVYFEDKIGKDDAVKLAPLVASADYQNLRKSDVQHYRAWWLMNKIGRDPLDSAWMLLVSSWESDDQPLLKQKYQRAFVAEVGKVALTTANHETWFWTALRAADVWRELGDFVQSDALLDRLDRAEVLPTDKGELSGARFTIDGLRALNADRNAKSEPTNMIPAMVALGLCTAKAALTPAEVKACAGPEIEKARRARSE